MYTYFECNFPTYVSVQCEIQLHHAYKVLSVNPSCTKVIVVYRGNDAVSLGN